MALFGLFERRASLESPATPISSSAILELLGGDARTEAGVTVTETSAMAMSAVYRCTAVISSVGAALPLHSYRRGTKERADSDVLDDPHPEMTPYDLWKLNFAHRCLWGNGYTQKVRNGAGQVKELWPVTPSRVRVDRERGTEGNPTGKVFWVTDDWGALHKLTPREILHIPALGYDGLTGCSPVRLATRGIGLALAAEKHGATLFGSGNLLSGILQTEQRLQPAEAERLRMRWKKMTSGLDRSHETAVLDAGAKFEPLTMPNDDAQLLESREFQVTDIARFFGVPQFLLSQTSKTTSWGTGLEQQAQGFVTFDLHPQWLAPTEQRITKELLVRGKYAKYTVEGLLRGDSQARSAFYQAMWGVGAFSPDDIRALEDRPPLPDGQGRTYYVPMNYVPVGTPPEEQDDDGATVDFVPAAGSSNGNGSH